MIRKAFYILCLLVGMGLGVSHAQGLPVSGTQIINQAQATILNKQIDDSLITLSNKVVVNVQPVEMIPLHYDQFDRAQSGTEVQFSHTVKNIGNTKSEIQLTVSNKSGDDFDLQNLKIISKNKSTSAANPLQLTISLQPGDAYTFTYQGQVPQNATTGQLTKISVGAKTSLQGIQSFNTDIIRVVNGPELTISKTANPNNVEQGDALHYSLTGKNTGDLTAAPIPVTVDQQDAHYVLVRDRMPPNTTFSIFDDAGSGTKMYHLRGESEHLYHSTPPQQLSDVDAIATGYDSLQVGEDFSMKFTVTINKNASGKLKNTAQAFYIDQSNYNIQKVVATSNKVVTTLPQKNAALSFYADGDYNNKTNTGAIGEPLYIQADAAICNDDIEMVDTTTIRITSSKTNDQEDYRGVETGPNSGYFRILPYVDTRDANQYPVVKGNHIMDILEDDNLIAKMPECGVQAQALVAKASISPYGIVFNSQTNEPIAGAKVKLIDLTGQGNGGNAGGLAHVYNSRGDKRLPAEQVTGDLGKFNYPYLKASTYRIEVTPPGNYQYPSKVDPNSVTFDRTLDSLASYHKKFTVTQSATPVDYDLPLDPQTNGILITKKEADRSDMQVGDFITYKITVTNKADFPLPDTHVEDTLPFGFKYQKKSAHLNGKSLDDPKGGAGPQLSFNINTLAPGASSVLTYRAQAGPGSNKSDGKNVAIAISNGTLHVTSNKAIHKVDINEGVFSDRGYIVGKVFMDVNKNKIQDPGEHGVPGVRLYLENGLFVITDSEGKYTFYGIRPRKHVLKLDNYSLPKGSSLEILDNNHAKDPSSRFVQLTNGEMQRADFAICLSDSDLARELKKRRDAMSHTEDELSQTLKHDLRTTPRHSGSNGRREQASGTIGNEDVPDIKHSTSPDTSSSEVEIDTSQTTQKRDPRALEKAMIHTDNELGFMKLIDGDTLHVAQTDVWVKSPLDAQLTLTINGKPVQDNRISKKSRLSQMHMQAYEYIGLKLQPGMNTLEVIAKDPFGNVRGKKSIRIFAPGKLKTIQLTQLNKEIPADGQSTARLNITVLDAHQIPLNTRLPVTLKTTNGEFLVKDNDAQTTGIQTYIDGVHNTIELKAPTKPQKVKISVAVGTNEVSKVITFIPNLRPLLAAGIVEGTIRLNGSAKVVPASSADGFERELKTLSYTSGDMTADARAALYLKGKIKGNYLLTARVNTEKEKDKKLFRNIEPDNFYPVYGESSIKGFDAQSTGRFYVRIDKNQTYALYGDFITQKRDPAKSLGEYNRILTGLKSHYESDHVSLTAFGSQSSSLRKVEEIRGLGISGPYNLQSQDIVPNSEKVEIITRDRNQPSVIIDEQTLERYTDYTLEPYTGSLLFRMPISSLDKDLNPIYIRVTYEVYDHGDQYMIGGLNGEYAISKNFKVGGSYINDQNPDNHYQLKSLNSTINFSSDTRLITEIAKSTTDLSGSGMGKRFEFQYRGDKADVRVYGGNADRDFRNRTARYQPGTTEAGARGNVKLSAKSSLKGEMLYSSIDTTKDQTIGFLMNFDRRIGKNLLMELGVRHSRQQVAQQSNNKKNFVNTNVRSKVTTDIPGVDGASVYGEYEQDVQKADRKVVAVGGDYNIPNTAKLYARHEFISSALGRYTLRDNQRRQNTVVGIDANYMKNGKVYSEYRINDALDGQNGQAAIGLRNQFKIRDGFKVNAGIERVISVFGDPLNEGMAISSALEYTANPMWKATARAEARFGKNGNMYLSTMGYGRKISRDWTFLGKNVFALTTSSKKNSSNKIQERARVGLAFRETKRNRWSGLSRYELRYEQNGNYGGDFNRLVHIFSTHINYHPTAKWALTSHLAAKKVAETYDQLESKSFTTLYSAKGTYDINSWLDAGIKGSMLSNANLIDRQYGLGTEVGFIARRNLRIALGYNLFGFQDRDLTESNYTQKGAYVGMSYKFDERLFRGLMPDRQMQHPEVYAICRACNIYKNAKTLPFTKVEIPQLESSEITAQSISNFRNLIFLPRNIHFAFNQYAINMASANMLDRVATYLGVAKDRTLNISGYTDLMGSYNYNLKLSRRRALAAKAYLVAAGVAPEKITSEGRSFGHFSAARDSGFVNRAKNRAVFIDTLQNKGSNLRLVQQVNDLQIEKNLRQLNTTWSFVFNPAYHAVPDRIHFENGTDSLNLITKYILDRTADVLKDLPKTQLTFKIPASSSSDVLYINRKRILKKYLLNRHLSENQIIIKPEQTNSFSSNTILINYNPKNDLNIQKNTDDEQLPIDTFIKQSLHNMKQTLSTRVDSLLIYPDDQTDYLPGKIQIIVNNPPLSPVSTGIMARVGSYMNDHPEVGLTLTLSNKHDRVRAQLAKSYLITMGIQNQRIQIEDNDPESDNNHWIKLRYTGVKPNTPVNIQIEKLYNQNRDF